MFRQIMAILEVQSQDITHGTEHITLLDIFIFSRH